jgi:hypothetical protein
MKIICERWISHIGDAEEQSLLAWNTVLFGGVVGGLQPLEGL